MTACRSRSERKEQLTIGRGSVEAVPTVVTVLGSDVIGCVKTGCDVMIGAMISGDDGTRFCDVFLTWEQARKLHADIGALIESQDKGAT